MNYFAAQSAELPLIIVTRKNIIWKLVRGYCLCYCKTFLLVPDPTECTKILSNYITISNNIIGQRKTTNTKKTVLSMIDFGYLT